MHTASVSMKRFALSAFVLGVSIARLLREPEIVGITLFAIAAFYVLDAKYLQAERAFRVIYDDIRSQPPGGPASFDLTPARPHLVPWREFRSWSTILLYLPMLAILVAMWLRADW